MSSHGVAADAGTGSGRDRSARDVDAVVVGGGHNGLICAGYLARAGVATLLVEARDEVGGCASTVSDLDARFNICSCDHTLVRAMPFMDDLDLAAHGLKYLEADPTTVYMDYDGSPPWLFFNDSERTIESIGRPPALPGQGLSPLSRRCPTGGRAHPGDGHRSGLDAADAGPGAGPPGEGRGQAAAVEPGQRAGRVEVLLRRRGPGHAGDLQRPHRLGGAARRARHRPWPARSTPCATWSRRDARWAAAAP